uniref:Uncharacterized protein n=1 Tax=Nelumbo nucifera TaxID=4432 RepID=A0A822YUQ8_NELNU|nr:TPA_asm: hypothetical protein HUJ06_005799 [Nelumbo nucifera]
MQELEAQNHLVFSLNFGRKCCCDLVKLEEESQKRMPLKEIATILKYVQNNEFMLWINNENLGFFSWF